MGGGPWAPSRRPQGSLVEGEGPVMKRSDAREGKMGSKPKEEAGGATSLVWAVECLAEELLREASLELKVQQAG